MANRMVRVWGMSEKLGPMAYDSGEEQIFIGRDVGHAKEYSEDTARKIDAEVSGIINRNYQKAREVLEENLDILHSLAELLLEKETVMGAELDALIKSMKPDFDPPKPENLFKDEELLAEVEKDDTPSTEDDDAGDKKQEGPGKESGDATHEDVPDNAQEDDVERDGDNKES